MGAWRRQNAAGGEGMKKKIRAAAAAACVLALSTAFGSYGRDDDEAEREPVGEIRLSFYSDIEAGSDGGDVEVNLESGNCSVDEVEVTNDDGQWAGGDEPRVKVWLHAEDGYYFDEGGRDAFDLSGGATYKSSTRKDDKEIMILTVVLDELDEGDLGVWDLEWDESYGIASWGENDQAKEYKVRLYREDTAVGSVKTTKLNTWDFSQQMDRPGSYTFKVRVIDWGNNGGDWEESGEFEVTAEDVAHFVGAWEQDGTGWWYRNPDGSYPVNAWKEIRGAWYFFDQSGYMKTGWIDWNGKQYYCGAENGAMLVNTVTPDGIYVGADGARVG